MILIDRVSKGRLISYNGVHDENFSTCIDTFAAGNGPGS